MFFTDFEYDGIALSSFGFTVCEFGGKDDMETSPIGSELQLTTYTSNFGRQKHKLGSSYESCISAQFCICKNPCIYGDENLEITIDELREINRWLNRHDYFKFKIIDCYEYIDFCFEATFNVSKIMVDDRIMGLELNMETNRPYAIGNYVVVNLSSTTDNWKGSVNNFSDEEGHVYPKMEIIVNKAGTLDIFNETEQRHFVIKNCVVGEKINIEYPMTPVSSIPSHKIGNDFNWNFFRLIKKYDTSLNQISVSLPCDIKMEYTPTVKVGI